MKAKGLKLSSIILAIGAMFLALVGVSVPSQTIAAAGSTNSRTSSWMLTADGNGDVVRANSAEQAGVTTGYDKYLLGEENVELKATANEGFDVYEWYVKYNDGIADKELVLDSVNSTATITVSYEHDDETLTSSVELTSTYTDVDGDGLYDESELTFSKVFDSVQVEPIFDYTYYNLDTTGLIENLDATVVEGVTPYVYTAGEVATKKEDQFIKVGEDTYFFDEVYNVGTSYYVLQNGKKADISKGAYTLNEKVDFAMNILGTKTIQAKGLTLTSTSGNVNLSVVTDALADNSVKFETNSYKLTTALLGNVTIKSSTDLKNSLELSYNNVYKVTLDIKLNGEDASSGVVDLLIKGTNKVIATENAVAEISATEYYVRNAADDPHSKSFTIVADNYKEIIDNQPYTYYTYNNMKNGASESAANRNVYATFTGATTITINYTAKEYAVNFQFAVLQDNGTILIANEGKVNNPLTITRGETKSLPVTAEKNTGYTFDGYTDSLSADVEKVEGQYTLKTKLTTVTMAEDKPSDVTILMVYKKANYTLKLTNYNQISINDGTKDIYPLEKVVMTVNGENSSAFADFSSTELTLSSSLRINDTIVFTEKVTDGFIIDGYYFTLTEGQLLDLITGSYFTLNNSVIENYDKDNDNVITIYVGEAYNESYSITYYIEDKTAESGSTVTNGVMANIDVVLPTRAAGDTQFVVNKEYVSAEGIEADTYVKSITVTKIRKYDLIKLTSKGITETPEGEDPYTYMFIMFTADKSSAMTNEYTAATDTYEHSERMVRSRTIEVIYTTPKSVLFVQVDETNKDGLASLIEVTVDGSAADIDQETDGYLLARTKAVVVTFTIRDGYVLDTINHTGNLLPGDTVEDKTTRVVTYTFTVDTDQQQTITIYFEAVEYQFKINQTGGGTGYDGESIIKTLDAHNLTLSFVKPTGYYVSAFKLAGATQNYSYASKIVLENNDVITESYSYEFDLEEFLTLVAEKAVVVAENVEQVEINIDYTVHTFIFNIQKNISNAKNNSFDDSVQFPGFTLTYKFGNDEPVDVSAKYLNATKQVQFNNIPYGSQVTVATTDELPLGVEFVSWMSGEGALTGTYDSLSIDSLTNNRLIDFVLKYTEYTVVVTAKEANQGNPVVYVNGAKTDKITIYDKLSIVADDEQKGFKNGYKFDALVYNVLTAYTYNASWASEYENLYVVANGKYVKNTSDTYVPTVTYYQLTEVVYTESSTFAPENVFHVRDFYANETGVVLFEISYKLREITIQHESKDYDASRKLPETAITADKYATYTIEGETKTTFTKEDSIEITVQINKNVKNGLKNEYFDLTQGLLLIEDFTSTLSNYEVINNGDGNYTLKFNIADVMADIPATDVLKIVYVYIISDKTLTVTTNVNSVEFNKNIELAISASSGSSSGTSGTEERSDIFLSKSTVTFDYLNNYENYVSVYDINVQAVTYFSGVAQYSPISEDKWEIYGVKVNKTADVITSIDVRNMSNLKITLIMSPIVNFNRASLEDGLYTFTTTFKGDVNGLPVAQPLTKGTNSTYNISSAQIVINAMKVTYVNQEDEFKQQIESPSNAGVYDVIITFNTTNAEFAWLTGLDVAYDVRYVINQKDISINYNAQLITQQTKEYNGKSSVLVTDWLKAIVFTDNTGFSMSYSKTRENIGNGISSFGLDGSLYKAYTSFTQAGQEVETANANENAFYNVTIDGLELLATSEFNKNYNLTNSSVVIRNCLKIARKVLTVSGIQVYDKVFDGTDAATVVQDTNIDIKGVLTGESVTINKEMIAANFVDFQVGRDKVVVVNATKALEGEYTNNYYVAEIRIQEKVVYPYSLNVEFEDGTELTLFNNVGLTDPTKVNLIPVDAKLKVSKFVGDSATYANIYTSVSKHMSRTNAFVIGYRLYLDVDGVTQYLDKNLHVSLPSIDNLTKVVGLSGQESDTFDYEVKDGYVLIDLSKAEGNVSHILLTQKRAFLQLWQIILIVIASVVVVGGAVTAFIIIRKKKSNNYNKHDKI